MGVPGFYSWYLFDLCQVDQTISTYQAYGRKAVPAWNRLPLPRYERHHLQMCQGTFTNQFRMTLLSSRRKSCPRSSNKSGLKSSTTSTTSSTFSNPIRWSFWLWMVWLHDQKWTIKGPEGSRVPETTNNLLNDFTATMSKVLTVNKISRITQFLQAPNSCKNWMKWSTFSFKKKFRKTITGKI